MDEKCRISDTQTRHTNKHRNIWLQRLTRMRQMIMDSKKKADSEITYYSDYMETGVWKCSENMVFLYKKGFRGYQQKEGQFVWREIQTRNSDYDGTEIMSRRIFSKIYSKRVKSQPNHPQGSVLAFTSRDTSVKIFNYDKKFVLTKYKNDERMKADLDKKKLWAGIGGGTVFSTVPILEYDYDNLYIKETLLNKEGFLPENAFQRILSDYRKFYSERGKDSKKGTIEPHDKELLMNNAEKKGFAELGKRALALIESDDYRINLTHGELSPLNIIFSDGEYYYIDFETVGERYFFYDLAYFMSKAFLTDKSDLLSKYLKGAYDDSLTEIFSLNGAHYNPKDRRVYLFLCEMLYSGYGQFSSLLNHRELFAEE